MSRRATPTAAGPAKPPPAFDWRTTDADEIAKRRQRALAEPPKIVNLTPRFALYGDFRVQSVSGMTYTVEVRAVAGRQFSCDCVDFRTNGLGTCKHVEAVLLHLQARFPRPFAAAQAADSSPRIDIVPAAGPGTLRVERGLAALPAGLRRLFAADGRARGEFSPEQLLERLAGAKLPALRLSQEIQPWLETRRRTEESRRLRREYEGKVQAGEWPVQETLLPLLPYQREGMLHLAFTERALLADEMGLGKTVQAIAACALLHRLGKVRRVLVVSPASLKTEWEEQIQRFTKLPYQLVFGQRHQRLRVYANAPFYTLVNYEQMLSDAMEINTRLCPDVVVLDEAQRIKNWNTKTAQAVKRLRSRYAFVLTGTPLENRIDELYSILEFLNPALFGPLFRFNREFYQLDERGRPKGFQNLDQLHQRIRPVMLRRRKAEVETELPERTERQFFVPLAPAQRAAYQDHEGQVARLLSLAKRRPLTQQEQEKLMRELAMMRMVCDTTYILDPEDRTSPKLSELEKLLEECRTNDGAKVIIFSEWERMLELVRDLCRRMDLGHAWHTGSVPQRRRRAEINLFKSDPACRVFLSTDSGSTGLNLQNAEIVVNCDLPWNPAKLEQRIARAWRKGQTRAVTVINLVAENTIEHRMLGTLAAKQALADGVLDHRGDLSQIPFGGGRQAFLAKLHQLMATRPAQPLQPAVPAAPALPLDRSLAFSQRAREKFNGALLHIEERFPTQGAHSVLLVVVERDAGEWRAKLAAVHQELLGPGKADPLAPVLLEVLDRASFEALDRLTKAGLIASATRAIRPLTTPTEGGSAAGLSAAEQEQAAAHRGQAARKVKMARLLLGSELADEARPPLLDALLWAGRALAVEHRLPAPGALADVVRPPWVQHWTSDGPTLEAFLADPASPCPPVLEVLERVVAAR